MIHSFRVRWLSPNAQLTGPTHHPQTGIGVQSSRMRAPTPFPTPNRTPNTPAHAAPAPGSGRGSRRCRTRRPGGHPRGSASRQDSRELVHRACAQGKGGAGAAVGEKATGRNGLPKMSRRRTVWAANSTRYSRHQSGFADAECLSGVEREWGMPIMVHLKFAACPEHFSAAKNTGCRSTRYPRVGPPIRFSSAFTVARRSALVSGRSAKPLRPKASRIRPDPPAPPRERNAPAARHCKQSRLPVATPSPKESQHHARIAAPQPLRFGHRSNPSPLAKGI